MVGCDSDAESQPQAAPPVEESTPSAPATELTVPDFDPEDWSSVRAQFPLDPGTAQLAAYVLSPHTAQVNAAIDFHRARLGFDTELALNEGYRLEDQVRVAAARFAGGTARDFALT